MPEGDLQRLKVVGKGSFGCCWLAQDAQGAQCILKEIDVSRMPAKQKQEAENEVRVLAKLRHPFIINYRESFVENGLLCIVMDYAERGDIYNIIKEQRRRNALFPESLVVRWFTQIALALKHIHDRRILHRDLKTQNIFLSGHGEGTVKLGDFGIARVLQHNQDFAKTSIGTPYYLSPEICQELPYNHKSDVWALGCVLHELCTLRHAFDADSMRGLILKILKGVPPQTPEAFSESLRSLVVELLTKDPDGRPSVDEVLRRPLVRAMILKLLQEAQQQASRHSPAEPAAEEAASRQPQQQRVPLQPQTLPAPPQQTVHHAPGQLLKVQLKQQEPAKAHRVAQRPSSLPAETAGFGRERLRQAPADVSRPQQPLVGRSLPDKENLGTGSAAAA